MSMEFTDTQNEMLTNIINFLTNDCGYEETVDYNLLFTSNKFEIKFKVHSKMDITILSEDIANTNEIIHDYLQLIINHE